MADEVVARCIEHIATAGAQPSCGDVDAGIDALLVDDACLDVGLRPAEAVGADVARLAVGHDAGGRASLGHRPGFEQREAEALLERGVVALVDTGAEADYIVVEMARRLLEESNLRLDAIARRCGFGSEDRMRRTFHRVFGVSPREYQGSKAAA